MKRLLLCLLLLCALAGCAAKQTVADPITTGFSCKVDLTVADAAYTARLEIPSTALFIATLESPAAVQGTVLRWDGEAFTATLHGLTVQIPSTALPGGNGLKTAYRVLQSLSQDTASAVGNIRSGTVDGTKFTATLRADGFPLEIQLPEYQTILTFRDFSYTYAK